MEYALQSLAHPDGPLVEISAGQFTEFQRARGTLLTGLGVEEKFGTVLANYAEFEGALLRFALEDALFGWTLWNEGIDRLTEVNRLMLNFLATARLYVDQVTHSLSRHFGASNEIVTEFKRRKSEEYDREFGYRCMEELRNHAQHRDFSLHMARPQARVSDPEDPSRPIRRSYTATITTSRLADDPGFKTSVLEELHSKGERLDIRPLARDYVAGLGRVHAHLQGLMDTVFGDASGVIQGMVQVYRAAAGCDPQGLAAVVKDGSGRTHETVYLGAEVSSRREVLKERHRYAQFFARTHVSSEIGRTIPSRRTAS